MGWAGEWQRRFKSLDQQDESPEGLAQKISALSQVISLLRSRALGDESETLALAKTLADRGTARTTLGDADSLVGALRDADAAILHWKCIQHADRPEWAHDLAATHGNRGIALKRLGDSTSLQHAVKAFDTAIRLLESLQRADRPDWAHDLAAAHMNRGIALKMLGDSASLQHAVQAYDEAIRLQAPIQRTDRPDWANDLAAAHMNRGNALQKLGDSASLQHAVQAYDEAIRLRAPIQRPDRPDWAHDLAVAHSNRGHARLRLGGASALASAIDDYSLALDLMERSARSSAEAGVPLRVRSDRSKLRLARGDALRAQHDNLRACQDWLAAWDEDLSVLVRLRHIEGERLAQQIVPRLLRALAELNEWSLGLDIVQGALERLPHDREVYDPLHAFLAHILAAAVDSATRDRALALARRAEETCRLLFGEHAFAALREARALLARGRPGPARQRLRDWAETHPTDWTGAAAQLSLAVEAGWLEEARAHRERALELLRTELRGADAGFLDGAQRALPPLLGVLLESGTALELADLRATTGPAAFVHNQAVRQRAGGWIGRVQELAEQLGLGAALRSALGVQAAGLAAHERRERELGEGVLRADLEQAYREETAALRDALGRQQLRFEAYAALLGRTLAERMARLNERIDEAAAVLGRRPDSDPEAQARWDAAWDERLAALLREFAGSAPEGERRAALDRVHDRLGDRFWSLDAGERGLLAAAAEAAERDGPEVLAGLAAQGLTQALELVLARRLLLPARAWLPDGQREPLLTPLVGASSQQWATWTPQTRKQRLKEAERTWKQVDQHLSHLLGHEDALVYLRPLLYAVSGLLEKRYAASDPLPLRLLAEFVRAEAERPALLLEADPTVVAALCEDGSSKPWDRLNRLRNQGAHLVDRLTAREPADLHQELAWALSWVLDADPAFLPLLLEALDGDPAQGAATAAPAPPS